MAKEGKTYEAKKPSLWSRMKTWQKALAILVGFIILVNALPSTEEVTKDFEEAQSAVEQNTEELQEAIDNVVEAEKPVVEEKPQFETVEEWQSVIKVNGSSDKQTEPFKITGKRWKVIYTVGGNNAYRTLYIYAKEPGDKYGDDIVSSAEENGETIVYTKGEFYLEMSSANCTWTVEVQQLVDVEKEIK